MDSTTADHLPRTKWGIAALFGLVGALVVSVVVMAFIWPAAASEVHDLPVGIAGPDEQVTLVEDALAEQDPAPFALQQVATRDEADERGDLPLRSRRAVRCRAVHDQTSFRVVSA